MKLHFLGTGNAGIPYIFHTQYALIWINILKMTLKFKILCTIITMLYDYFVSLNIQLNYLKYVKNDDFLQ